MIKINKKTIVKDIYTCHSVGSKAAGLMFHPRIKDKAFVFVNREEEYVPLHMFFVFQTIDVLFLDSDKKIADIKQDFRPFTLYFPKKNAKYVIELPQDTVRKKKIKLGDKCEFKA
jgi:uncharacterized protein